MVIEEVSFSDQEEGGIRRHEFVMQLLLVTQTGRALWNIVSGQSVEELRRDLSAIDCSAAGEVSCLRDRLFRAYYRGVEPDNAAIPWYADDRAEPMEIESVEEGDLTEFSESGDSVSDVGARGGGCVNSPLRNKSAAAFRELTAIATPTTMCTAPPITTCARSVASTMTWTSPPAMITRIREAANYASAQQSPGSRLRKRKRTSSGEDEETDRGAAVIENRRRGDRRVLESESRAGDSRESRPNERTAVEIGDRERRRVARPGRGDARVEPQRARSDGESESSRESGCTVKSLSECESALSRKLRLVKLLQRWGLAFSGEDSDANPEEFLENLEDCCDATYMSDRELLSTLPCVLKGKAARWYRAVRFEIGTGEEFARAFRRRFVRERDREDLLSDLRRRTQAPGEPVTSFLADHKYIVSRFREPPSRRAQVEQAFRNLLPEYRRVMADKCVETLEDIERYGRRWERLRELDERYVPPPRAEEMHVPGAAVGRASLRSEVAGVWGIVSESSEDSEDSESVESEGSGGSEEDAAMSSSSESASSGDSPAIACHEAAVGEVSVLPANSSRTRRGRRGRHVSRPAEVNPRNTESPVYSGAGRVISPSEWRASRGVERAVERQSATEKRVRFAVSAAAVSGTRLPSSGAAATGDG